tara:strand:- start:4027 stop:4137 length:111 start_codon:yes stop_codon:yes gene_type:complete
MFESEKILIEFFYDHNFKANKQQQKIIDKQLNKIFS